jgi:hypothetical protein
MPEVTRDTMIRAGWTARELDALDADGFWFSEVKVLEPCGCGPCQADQRWFYCQRLDARAVARYLVIVDGSERGGGSMPRDDNPGIVSIWEKHPGKVLIY